MIIELCLEFHLMWELNVRIYFMRMRVAIVNQLEPIGDFSY